jgi:hypothetical protein
MKSSLGSRELKFVGLTPPKNVRHNIHMYNHTHRLTYVSSKQRLISRMEAGGQPWFRG